MNLVLTSPVVHPREDKEHGGYEEGSARPQENLAKSFCFVLTAERRGLGQNQQSLSRILVFSMDLNTEKLLGIVIIVQLVRVYNSIQLRHS